MSKSIQLKDKNNEKFYPIAFETISNSNGVAYKFADGTLICTNRLSQTKDINTPYESSYFTSTGDITFPVEFISEPNVMASIEMNNSLLGLTIVSRHTNRFGCYIWKQQAKNGITYYVNYIAIGRWK